MAGSPELRRLVEVDRPFSMRLAVSNDSAYLIGTDIVLGALRRKSRTKLDLLPNLLIGHKREDIIFQVDPESESGIRKLPDLDKDYGTLIMHYRGQQPIYIGDTYMVEYLSRDSQQLGLVISSASPIGAERVDGTQDFASLLRNLNQGS